jgi:hypothetical protein
MASRLQGNAISSFAMLNHTGLKRSMMHRCHACGRALIAAQRWCAASSLAWHSM